MYKASRSQKSSNTTIIILNSSIVARFDLLCTCLPTSHLNARGIIYFLTMRFKHIRRASKNMFSGIFDQLTLMLPTQLQRLAKNTTNCDLAGIAIIRASSRQNQSSGFRQGETKISLISYRD